ncbi:MAG: hypothetical protein J5621_08115 [Paludibacteraceae bacterium]|nr:hypothetical protein [Paludibacteraceae bacterium]
MIDDDKKLLDAMDSQLIENLVLAVENFINKANQLLNTYPAIDFSNCYDTAFQSDNISNKVREFSSEVSAAFINIFGENRPSVLWEFSAAFAVAPIAISDYGTARNILENKRDILVNFKKELDKYLGKK